MKTQSADVLLISARRLNPASSDHSFRSSMTKVYRKNWWRAHAYILEVSPVLVTSVGRETVEGKGGVEALALLRNTFNQRAIRLESGVRNLTPCLVALVESSPPKI